MVKTLTQTVRFQGATADDLWRLYMDAKEHTAALGSEARITARTGAKFSAWDGYIEGKNLSVLPKRLVVQSWRASDWTDDDPDSVLVLSFRDVDGAAEVDMVHANVPDDQAEALDEGWKENYWDLWKARLKGRQV